MGNSVLGEICYFLLELLKRVVWRLSWLATCQHAIIPRSHFFLVQKHSKSILEDVIYPKYDFPPVHLGVSIYLCASQNNEDNYLYSRPPPKTTWQSVMVDLVGISWFKGLKFLGHADLFVFHGHRVPTSTLSGRGLFTRRNQRSKSGDEKTRGLAKCVQNEVSTLISFILVRRLC